jgi:hypothetical protein
VLNKVAGLSHGKVARVLEALSEDR